MREVSLEVGDRVGCLNPHVTVGNENRDREYLSFCYESLFAEWKCYL